MLLLLLESVSAIVVPQEDEQLLPPLIPLLCDKVHVKVVAATLDVSETLGAEPLHMEAEDGIAAAIGFGCTVTSTVNGDPKQPFAIGVTVYVKIPSIVPLLVSICEILVPEVLLKPVIVPPVGVVVMAAVQENVVPFTVEFNATLVVVPLQIV